MICFATLPFPIAPCQPCPAAQKLHPTHALNAKQKKNMSDVFGDVEQGIGKLACVSMDD